ncbi:MAG: DUF4276 family protein [Candidatus Thiodiazotropha sp. (ex Rostrolucina anterorostrata)]|nr:DUF4276 family protein [Candidatus Thiodiazotropha sp. (ex Rostrolucina anterorostrata)]
MHELKALLFSDTDTLGKQLSQSPKEIKDITNRLKEIIRKKGIPEDINDNTATSPSYRILNLCSNYQRILATYTIANEIGLNVIRKECLHIDAWLKKLKSLQ